MSIQSQKCFQCGKASLQKMYKEKYKEKDEGREPTKWKHKTLWDSPPSAKVSITREDLMKWLLE